MPRSPDRFARLLSQAVRQIAWRQNSKINHVQDELGYALGRESGGASIEYWRKGYIPAKLAELELLARELAQRGGLTSAAEVAQFLDYGDHPQPQLCAGQIAPETLPYPFPQAPPTGEPAGHYPLPEEHPAFIAGLPITHPRYFFGRTRECKRVFNLLGRRPLQNAAIIGPRRSGKTSLLYYLKTINTSPSVHLRPDQRNDWLPAPEQYRWLFIDFQDSRLGQRAGLLRYLLAGFNLPVPEPCTLDRFLDIASQNLRQPAVVLLDEIGVALQRYPELDDSFWEGLRSLAAHHAEGKLAFILAAPEPPEQLARHNGLGSPFFNIFGYTAYLGAFEEAEARALISSSPVTFSEDDIEWILDHSGRWPLLLQILCRERLISLEEGDVGPLWREEGLRQMAPFRRLLG